MALDPSEQVIALAQEIIDNAEEAKLLLAEWRAQMALDDADNKTPAAIEAAKQAQRELQEWQATRGGNPGGK